MTKSEMYAGKYTLTSVCLLGIASKACEMEEQQDGSRMSTVAKKPHACTTRPTAVDIQRWLGPYSIGHKKIYDAVHLQLAGPVYAHDLQCPKAPQVSISSVRPNPASSSPP